jgi:CubicO group peptidase (beta-lactamase class C family)
MKSLTALGHPATMIAVAVSLSTCSSSLPSGHEAPEPSSEIRALLSDYDGTHQPGAALMAAKNGRVLLKEAFGMADLENKHPVGTQTNFRLASVTKQFTALAVMILVRDDALRLDTRLTDIFPAFPEYGKAITVDHLVHHTSGLIDYESLLPDTLTVQVKDRDVLRLMEEQDSTYFQPGSEFRYSNSGYAVLGMIIETVSGVPFARFLASQVFIPAGMKRSVAFEDGVSSVPNRAYGYSRTDSGWVFTDQSITSAVLGDGGIYSSIDDLVTWLDVVQGRTKLIPDELYARLFEPAVLNHGDTVPYGFGWRLDDYKGKQRVYHGGSTRGFRNRIQWFPEEGLTLVFLSNRNEISEGFVEKITDVLLKSEGANACRHTSPPLLSLRQRETNQN